MRARFFFGPDSFKCVNVILSRIGTDEPNDLRWVGISFLKIVLIEEVSGGNNDKCASSFAKTAIFLPKRYLARHLTGVCVSSEWFLECVVVLCKRKLNWRRHWEAVMMRHLFYIYIQDIWYQCNLIKGLFKILKNCESI